MTRSTQSGFVFVEAMVALALVAGMAGMMFMVQADGAVRTRMVDNRRLGLLVAQSRLAAIGSEIPARPGIVSGVDRDFLWSVTIRPYAAGGRSSAGTLYHVTVTTRPRIASGQSVLGDQVELRSLCLGPAG